MRITLSVAALAAFCLPITGIPVTIDPGSYPGIIRITGFTEYSDGKSVTVDLLDGEYFLETGGSTIPFTVTAANSAAPLKSDHAGALIRGSKIGFNLLPLRFRSGGFTGACRFSHERLDREQCPPEELLNLIADVTYSLDLGGSLAGGSCFYFHLGSDGTLSNALPQARGSEGPNGLGLTLNTVEITIDPRGYTGRYAPAPYRSKTWTGIQKFKLVPGLKYGFAAGTDVNGSQFTATLDPDGNLEFFEALTTDRVRRVSPAFAMRPRVMGFANVRVRIDAPPGAPSSFQVGSLTGVKDKDEIVLLPSLVTRMVAEKTGDFLPTFSSVVPPAVNGYRFTIVEN